MLSGAASWKGSYVATSYAATSHTASVIFLPPDIEDQPSVELREAVTGSMAGLFAALFLTLDVFFCILTSVIQGKFLLWTLGPPFLSSDAMFFIGAGLSGLANILMIIVREPPQPAESQNMPFDKMLRAAVELWPSATIWCLSLTNLTFGVSAAFMNGVVNSSYASPNSTLGGNSIGTLLALTSLFAACFATLFGKIHMCVGKGPIILFGSVAFAALSTSVLFFKPSQENDYWGYWLMTLYLLQGLGRSVYEGTNKAIFADFFPGMQAVGAFANQMMQNSIAFFTCFILQAVLPEEGAYAADQVLPILMLVLAALSFPGYLMAVASKRRSERDFLLIQPGQVADTSPELNRSSGDDPLG